MLDQLKESVFKANQLLVDYGLVILTWGNVSAIDREKGLVVIKPSGVKYDQMKADDMVAVDMDGKIISGNLKPSSDLSTHLVLYNSFPEIGGVAHTHSEWATARAQAGKGVPVYGTTHADYFYGEIPCTRPMTASETAHEYENNTGHVIVERFKDLNPNDIPSVLVHGHGPFSWGKDAMDAVNNALVLEEVSKMAFRTEMMGNNTPLEQHLIDKHFLRKHGKGAYYGQNPEKY